MANIHSYRQDFKVKDEDFKDLEKKPYQVWNKYYEFRNYCDVFIIAKILTSRQGYNCNNLNSHFDIFNMN